MLTAGSSLTIHEGSIAYDSGPNALVLLHVLFTFKTHWSASQHLALSFLHETV